VDIFGAGSVGFWYFGIEFEVLGWRGEEGRGEERNGLFGLFFSLSVGK
jgi:hypothetical protein